MNPLVNQTSLEVTQARAALTYSQVENQRAQTLLKEGSGTLQQAQQAQAAATIPSLNGSVSYTPVKPTNIFIQAGAFLQQSNALKLTQQLASLGQTRVTQARVGTQTFYRVRLGPIQHIEDADTLLQKVIGSGQPDARIVVE